MRKIAVIGGGAAGFMSACVALENNSKLEIDIFEKNDPLKTILYTGGGRCNITNATYDFKELAKSYPRGEKFLYSAFSRFGVKETINWFESHGLRLYTQDDNRVFPRSDDAGEVREFFITLAQNLGINIKSHEEVLDIQYKDEYFFIKTNKNTYKYDDIIISTGGNTKRQEYSGYKFAQKSGHTVTELKPSLVGYVTQEKWTSKLSGVAVKSVKIEAYKDKKLNETTGDILFTHNGISGPAVFRSSAYNAFVDLPIKIKINFTPYIDKSDLEKELLILLEKNSKKNIINIISDYIPRSVLEVLFKENSIDAEKKASQITKDDRRKLINLLTATELTAISTRPDGEIVTAGGVCLDEINPKTMESKLVPGLYFCGEVLNIDGLTGGFNLQAAWSTGYIAGIAL